MSDGLSCLTEAAPSARRRTTDDREGSTALPATGHEDISLRPTFIIDIVPAQLYMSLFWTIIKSPILLTYLLTYINSVDLFKSRLDRFWKR